jgi:hypothetical protein
MTTAQIRKPVDTRLLHKTPYPPEVDHILQPLEMPGYIIQYIDKKRSSKVWIRNGMHQGLLAQFICINEKMIKL